MKIILIGYRCTGKTAVGKEIAERLEIPFYDTDELVQRHTNKTIREIVDEGGWDAFRTEERAIIKKLSSLTDGVIAAGGGAVMDAENRNALKHNGLCIWLTADVKTIVERMMNDRTSTAQRSSRPGNRSMGRWPIASSIPRGERSRQSLMRSAENLIVMMVIIINGDRQHPNGRVLHKDTEGKESKCQATQ
jgi:shikimate kinase